MENNIIFHSYNILMLEKGDKYENIGSEPRVEPGAQKS